MLNIDIVNKYIEKIDSLTKEYQNLQSVKTLHTTQSKEIPSLFSKLKELKNKLETHEFNVGVVGTFNSGKSTFLNALLGKKILSTKILPETASITALKELKQEKEYAVVHFFNEAEWNSVCDLAQKAKIDEPSIFESIEKIKNQVGSQLSTYITKEGLTQKCTIEDIPKYTTVTTKGNLSPLVKIVEVFVHSEFCKDQINLIDTPGLNDPNKYREIITEQYLDKIDLLIMLSPVTQAFTEHDKNFLTKQLIKNRIRKTFFVVNKIDVLDDQHELNDVMEWLNDEISKTFKDFYQKHKNLENQTDIPLFSLSSQEAFFNKSNDPKAKWTLEKSKLPEFEKKLKHFLFEGPKFQTFLSNIQENINQIKLSRIEDLIKLKEDMNSSLDQIKTKIVEKEKEKEKFLKQEEQLTSKIEREIKSFENNNKQKIENVKLEIFSLKNLVQQQGLTLLETYIHSHSSGKDAAEGFRDWCSSDLFPELKNLIEYEMATIFENFKSSCEDDYDDLIDHVKGSYLSFYEEVMGFNTASLPTVGAVGFELSNDEDNGILGSLLIGLSAGLLLGPIGWIGGALNLIFNMFRGESEAERAQYINQINHTFYNKIIPQINKRLDDTEKDFRNQALSSLPNMLQAISTQLKQPLIEITQRREAEEASLKLLAQELSSGELDRTQKINHIDQEISFLEKL